MHEVTAVENVQYIADVYQQLFPKDKVVVDDAHQYLLDHHKEFDFIWSSPPCPTHSRVSLSFGPNRPRRYPDMSLYQEVILLKHFFKGKWIVENVISYYDPLITPMVIDRHYFWANFYIPHTRTGRVTDISRSPKEAHAKHLDIQLPVGLKDQRKLLRNAVDPKLGLHILGAAQKETKQEVLL